MSRSSINGLAITSAVAVSASADDRPPLAARALGYEGNKHVTVAALIEFIHTATLLHDDVVDDGTCAAAKPLCQRGVRQRRQRAGRRLYLYPRLPDDDQPGILRVLALMSEAVNVIAEGEVLQLMNVHDPDISEESYMRR